MVMQNKRGHYRTVCRVLALWYSIRAYSSEYFGGQPYSCGQCSETASEGIGVRLGLLMRCVRAFVGDIHHQCDTGMIQTECFVQIFSASSVWGWINYEVVVVAIEAGVRKTLRQTRKKIEAPSCRIRICHGHVLARRLPWSGWITDACGRIWWGCGCMNYL